MKKRFFTHLFYPYLLLVCSLSPVYAAEFSQIIINNVPVDNGKKSQWVKTRSEVSIFDRSGMKMTVLVEPDEGRVYLIDIAMIPIKVFIRDKVYDSTVVQFHKEIRKFRVSIRSDRKSQKKYIKCEIKLGKKLDFETTDLLIVTLLYRLGIRMLSRSVTMKIFKR